MIGQTLSHYWITAALGAGGMSEVYRATDTKLGPDVAIKVLPAEMVNDAGRPFSANELSPCSVAGLLATELSRGRGLPGQGDSGTRHERPRATIPRVTVDDLPEWERLLAAERHLQDLVPGAVLVGGTAAALHAGHRKSLDGDHVLEDLRARFDDVLAELETAAGWRTSRVQRPVVILGQLDGVMTGIRQLRRTKPLETELVEGLRVPTLREMARVKAWLLATRHTVRDYLDTVVLLERLGEAGATEAFVPFDELYAQESGASPLVEVVERLGAAAPSDRAKVDLIDLQGPRGAVERLVSPHGARAALGGGAGSRSADRRGPLSTSALERTVVGWNRSRLDLRSDEVLAQILDRGDLAAWKELYALAAEDRPPAAADPRRDPTGAVALPGVLAGRPREPGRDRSTGAPPGPGTRARPEAQPYHRLLHVDDGVT